MNLKIILTTVTFLFYLSGSSQLLWSRTGGEITSSVATIKDVSTDPIDGGPVYSLGHKDGYGPFIAKMGPLGTISWIVYFTGDIQLNAIEQTSLGYIIVAGKFKGTVDFDPSQLPNDIFNLTSVNGSYDICVFQLTSNGSLNWANKIGGVGDDEAKCLDVEGSSVYFGGYYGLNSLNANGGFDFNPTIGADNQGSKGAKDIFISKWHTSGSSYDWTRTITSVENEEISSIKVNDSRVIVTGSFQNSIELYDDQTTASQFLHTSAGSSDIFIANFDLNGVFQWSKGIGTQQFEEGTSCAIDADGYCYITGTFSNDLNFDITASNANLIANSTRGFVLKLDSLGLFKFVKSIEPVGNATSRINKITVDSNSNFYLTGYFTANSVSSGIDIDISQSQAILSSSMSPSVNQIFVSKHDSTAVMIWGKQLKLINNMGGAPNNFLCKGNSIATTQNSIYCAGEFGGTVDFEPNTGVLNVESNLGPTQTPYLIKLYNCSSPSVTSINVTSCQSYTSQNGNVYYSSGNYIEEEIGNNGCTAHRSINLTITDSLSNAQLSTGINGIYLYALSPGLQYQWINCSNNQVISGETNQDFIPSINGEFAVIITQGNCSDTSACMTVSGIGIDENFVETIKIYPNPSTNYFVIESVELVDYAITGLCGNLISTSQNKNIQHEVDVTKFSNGTYFVRVFGDKINSMTKINVQH